MQPIAAKLEELSRICAEIWKFFLKRDHDFCSLAWCLIPAWNSASLTQAEIIPAGAHWGLRDAPTCEWHLQTDRHPEIADQQRRNANTPLHQSPEAFRALSLHLRRRDLPSRRFPARGQSRPQYPPA